MGGAKTPEPNSSRLVAKADVVLTSVGTPAGAGRMSHRQPHPESQGGGQATVVVAALVAKVGGGLETLTVLEPTTEAGKTPGVNPQPDASVPSGSDNRIVDNPPATSASRIHEPFPSKTAAKKLYNEKYPDPGTRNEANEESFKSDLRKCHGPSVHYWEQLTAGCSVSQLEEMRKRYYTISDKPAIQKRKAEVISSNPTITKKGPSPADQSDLTAKQLRQYFVDHLPFPRGRENIDRIYQVRGLLQRGKEKELSVFKSVFWANTHQYNLSLAQTQKKPTTEDDCASDANTDDELVEACINGPTKPASIQIERPPSPPSDQRHDDQHRDHRGDRDSGGKMRRIEEPTSSRVLPAFAGLAYQARPNNFVQGVHLPASALTT